LDFPFGPVSHLKQCVCVFPPLSIVFDPCCLCLLTHHTSVAKYALPRSFVTGRAPAAGSFGKMWTLLLLWVPPPLPYYAFPSTPFGMHPRDDCVFFPQRLFFFPFLNFPLPPESFPPGVVVSFFRSALYNLWCRMVSVCG